MKCRVICYEAQNVKTPADIIPSCEEEETHENKTPPTRSTLCRDALPFVPENATPPTPPPGLTVKLLQASRIPARHQKVIKVEIDEGEGDSLFMFAPNQVELQQHGLVMVMVDSIMDVEGGRCVKLLVENHSYEPRHLKEGMELGEAQPVQLLLKETGTGVMLEPEPTLPPTSDDPYIAALKNMPAQLRQKKLLELLNLKDIQLEPDHMAQLESFLVEWEDVFALDDTELGSTDITHHHIETGEHSPIYDSLCVGRPLLSETNAGPIPTGVGIASDSVQVLIEVVSIVVALLGGSSPFPSSGSFAGVPVSAGGDLVGVAVISTAAAVLSPGGSVCFSLIGGVLPVVPPTEAPLMGEAGGLLSAPSPSTADSPPGLVRVSRSTLLALTSASCSSACNSSILNCCSSICSSASTLPCSATSNC